MSEGHVGRTQMQLQIRNFKKSLFCVKLLENNFEDIRI